MIHVRQFALFAASVLLAASAGGAWPAEPAMPRYNAVGLQAEVQREVQNDRLDATLYVELTDTDPAALADTLNKRIGEAMRLAKEAQGVQARSGGNRTFPVYARNNVLEGWRGRAEIRIESRDFEAASRLIGRLQASLQLAGVSFSVSPESRRAVENQLIAGAIAAFKARAEIAKTALGGRGYRLVRLNVGHAQHVPVPRLAMARAAAAPQGGTPPSLEAGFSQVRVTADGTIEILD